MRNTKWMAFLLLVLVILSGCQEGNISLKTSDIDSIKTWFAEYAPDYKIVDIQNYGDEEYILLTTFTPPGEEEHYTMVRTYIINGNGDNYIVDALKDAYGAGSAGFTVELLGVENITIIFGDIGSAMYDFETDTMKEVVFSEVIVELDNGEEKNIFVENNEPYIGIMEADAEVVDIIYKTENGDIHYSDYYSESLDSSPDNV